MGIKQAKKHLSIYKTEDYFPIEEMYHFATAKIREIDENIERLNKFKAILELVEHKTYSGTTPSKNECPIIKTLSNGGRNCG
ncbi:MerR family transcriptional regulator [Brevibacillus borstelensis AK1]|uniref:MerR family transcriptional regulator n=1 Tax=Brevibacillus borstelensis AK1 TaxID=1300222 RepID=M8E5X4_9BACL|nr:MerR family transcriptional regulator [Brevibacillus borstelensis AK1]